MNLLERLERDTEPVPFSGCWIWVGPINSTGYGRFTWDGRPQYAHRLSYSARVGPIPEGMTIDHLCRTPLCVNPAHLECVTRAENARRNRATHCRRGHLMSETRVRRQCGICHGEAHQKWVDRNPERVRRTRQAWLERTRDEQNAKARERMRRLRRGKAAGR